MRITIPITRTHGAQLPALWEHGGGYSNTGGATIIANGRGQPKRPVYIRRAGQLACAEHALFVVRPGDHIVEAAHHREDFSVRIQRIESIHGEAAEVVTIAHFDMGEWDRPEVAAQFEAAVEAARAKATCYHCREPHYYVDPEAIAEGGGADG
ncbi:hypothetical protein [Symbiobacterium terraclitae]|uniref:hypothetical protein n=1 Tax=Symbiobacterium terraclitae TaxID=557451 RepID=UPI0035B55DDB